MKKSIKDTITDTADTVETKATKLGKRAAKYASSKRDELEDMLDEGQGTFNRMAEETGRMARDMYDKSHEQFENLHNQASDAIQNKPMTAMTVAFAAGLVLSRFLRA